MPREFLGRLTTSAGMLKSTQYDLMSLGPGMCHTWSAYDLWLLHHGEAEVLALVRRQPNLFDAAATTVVPEQPFLPVEDRVGFVAGSVVPLVEAGRNDRVGRVALPASDTVPRPRDANLGAVQVEEADVTCGRSRPPGARRCRSRSPVRHRGRDSCRA